jgi:hypothetical protein
MGHIGSIRLCGKKTKSPDGDFKLYVHPMCPMSYVVPYYVSM